MMAESARLDRTPGIEILFVNLCGNQSVLSKDLLEQVVAAAMGEKAGEHSPAAILAAGTLLDSLDSDHDGCISIDELDAALKGASGTQLRHLFGSPERLLFDLLMAGDHAIDEAEFVEACKLYPAIISACFQTNGLPTPSLENRLSADPGWCRKFAPKHTSISAEKTTALANLFELADTSGDGVIDAEEFHRFLQSSDIADATLSRDFGMMSKLPRSFFETMFNELDVDSNGGLDSDEFVDAFADLFDNHGDYRIPATALGAQLTAMYAEYRQLTETHNSSFDDHTDVVEQHKHSLKKTTLVMQQLQVQHEQQEEQLGMVAQELERFKARHRDAKAEVRTLKEQVEDLKAENRELETRWASVSTTSHRQSPSRSSEAEDAERKRASLAAAAVADVELQLAEAQQDCAKLAEDHDAMNVSRVQAEAELEVVLAELDSKHTAAELARDEHAKMAAQLDELRHTHELRQLKLSTMARSRQLQRERLATWVQILTISTVLLAGHLLYGAVATANERSNELWCLVLVLCILGSHFIG